MCYPLIYSYNALDLKFANIANMNSTILSYSVPILCLFSVLSLYWSTARLQYQTQYIWKGVLQVRHYYVTTIL